MADLSPVQDNHKDIITAVELKQENERLKEQLNALKRLLANGWVKLIVNIYNYIYIYNNYYYNPGVLM